MFGQGSKDPDPRFFQVLVVPDHFYHQMVCELLASPAPKTPYDQSKSKGGPGHGAYIHRTRSWDSGHISR
jgi:hypothetical protein